jgi:hypothetical protein
LCEVVKTRKRNCRRVLTWFAGRWRNHQSKQAEKPHSKFRGRKTLNGPATRPKTPLAVENSVGKPAADQAPNAGTGKRAWRTPIPRFVPARPRLKLKNSWIIPGDWGKVGSGWLTRSLLSWNESFEGGGRIHQFLWQRSRAVSKREKGTWRRGAIRSCSEPSQVTQAGFGFE